MPEIRIKNAWLLRQNASVHLHELWAKDDERLADDARVDEIVESYRAAWEPYEAKIVQGMQEVLGLTFRQDIIDVYIAPWFQAFSDPMVIGVMYKPDRFVEILTHELIHRLLTDNNETPYGKRVLNEWQVMFGDGHSKTALIHIPVHATLQAVFDDVLHETNRTENDKQYCKESDDYNKAWKYVERTGYQKIIEQLKARSE